MKYLGPFRWLSIRPQYRVQAKGGLWFGRLTPSDGFTMVEIVVSIMVLSVASVALAGAMSTGYLGYRSLEKDMTSLSLATAQMELTKGPDTDYVNAPHTYFDTVLDGYDITVTAEDIEGRELNKKLQKILVTVSRNGKEVRTLEDYKSSRAWP